MNESLLVKPITEDHLIASLYWPVKLAETELTSFSVLKPVPSPNKLSNSISLSVKKPLIETSAKSPSEKLAPRLIAVSSKPSSSSLPSATAVVESMPVLSSRLTAIRKFELLKEADALPWPKLPAESLMLLCEFPGFFVKTWITPPIASAP